MGVNFGWFTVTDIDIGRYGIYIIVTSAVLMMMSCAFDLHF